MDKATHPSRRRLWLCLAAAGLLALGWFGRDALGVAAQSYSAEMERLAHECEPG